MSDFRNHLARMLENPEFQKEYENGKAEYEVTRALVAARIEQNLSLRSEAAFVNPISAELRMGHAARRLRRSNSWQQAWGKSSELNLYKAKRPRDGEEGRFAGAFNYTAFVEEGAKKARPSVRKARFHNPKEFYLCGKLARRCTDEHKAQQINR